MKFNEFESMIVPFINVRGGDIVYPYESLSVAVHNAIQDIYNEYRWSWLLNTKKIEEADWTDGNGYYLYDMGNIKFVDTLEVLNTSTGIQEAYEKVTTVTELDEKKYLVHGTYVITSEAIDCTVTYFGDYTWNLFMDDTSIEIPMPDKMIPALYYLVLSQIDVIEVTQAEGQTYSNYGKYTNKIKTLKENDLPIVGSIQGGNRA